MTRDLQAGWRPRAPAAIAAIDRGPAMRELERPYRAVFEANPHAMWIYDRRSLAFLAVNGAACRLYGYTREEFLAMSIADVRPAEDVPRLIRAVGVTRGEELAHDTGWRHRRKDGSMIEVEITSHALLFEGHRAQLVLVHDVTAQKAADRLLRESESTLRAFYQSAAHMMGVVEVPDDGLDVLHVYDNPSTERFLGVGPGGTTGRWLSDMGMPEPVRRLWVEHYQQSRREGAPARFEYESRLPGKRIWLSVNVAYVGVGASGRQRFSYVAEDVTERRQAQQALAEADRRKDEFLATLAHELRNPLAPISSGLEILDRDPPAPMAVQVRQMMGRQLRQMVHLVDDLLDIARISRGVIQLRLSRLTLQEAAAQALEAVLPAMLGREQAFTQDLPSEPVWLQGDATRLAQIIGNLLTNASKYTPRGGRIHLHVAQDGAQAQLEVHDNGLGIPPAQLEAVFGMFTQVPHTLPSAQGGLGIGLALVRHLVELHGGRVWAESDGPGCGSRFLLRLPVAGA